MYRYKSKAKIQLNNEQTNNEGKPCHTKGRALTRGGKIKEGGKEGEYG
jgi:hypothetical protein